MACGITHTTQPMGLGWDIGSDGQCHEETQLKRSPGDQKLFQGTSRLLFSPSVWDVFLCGRLDIVIGLGYVCVWTKKPSETPGLDIGSSGLTHSAGVREQHAEVWCTNEAPLGNEGIYSPTGDWLRGQALHKSVYPKAVILEEDSCSEETQWLAGCASIHRFGGVVSWKFLERTCKWYLRNCRLSFSVKMKELKHSDNTEALKSFACCSLSENVHGCWMIQSNDFPADNVTEAFLEPVADNSGGKGWCAVFSLKIQVLKH